MTVISYDSIFSKSVISDLRRSSSLAVVHPVEHQAITKTTIVKGTANARNHHQQSATEKSGLEGSRGSKFVEKKPMPNTLCQRVSTVLSDCSMVET